MADTGFLSPATLATITRVKRRAFVTRLDLHGRRTLVLRRGTVNLPAQDNILVVWANTQPTTGGADTVDVLSTEGEIQRLDSLDAKPGDLFTIDGRTAEIRTAAILESGIYRADFRVTGGR